MNFKLGDVYQDAKILQMANEAADQLTEEDEEWIRKLPPQIRFLIRIPHI